MVPHLGSDIVFIFVTSFICLYLDTNCPSSLYFAVPYVKLTLMNNGGTEVSSQQSGRKWFTRHPVFKRSFLFQLPQTNRLESSMRLTISDRNLLRADEKLGDLIFCWPKEKWQETTTTLQWRKVLKNPGQVVDAWHDVAYSL